MENSSGNSASKGKQSVVEEGTHFSGSLSSTCPIVVRGRVEGEVEAPSLTVSQSGAVHGRVKVSEIESRGELSGEFEADSVQLAGHVKDNTVIRAKSLDVKLGGDSGKMQVVFGECELSVGEAPVDENKRPKPRRSKAPPATKEVETSEA